MKYRKIKASLIFCLLPIALCFVPVSCHDKKESMNVDFKYSYFPVDSGHYVTYDVDSIFSYNTNFSKDTVHYQLKYVVTDTFYDANNDLKYEWTLFRSNDNGTSWNLDRVWHFKTTATTVLTTQDDITFISMVFPPQQNQSWNGNAYVATTDQYRDFLNWNYYYDNVDVPFTINNFSLDSTLTAIDVVDTNNFVQRRWRKEVYAKHIGMVYQEYELKTRQQPGSWETGLWNGFSIKMRMVDHN